MVCSILKRFFECQNMILQARDIHKNYGQLWVLKGVDVEIRQGEIASIVGPSGSGKSTLLHILGTLDHPNKGEVFINQQKINFLNDKELLLSQPTYWFCFPVSPSVA